MLGIEAVVGSSKSSNDAYEKDGIWEDGGTNNRYGTFAIKAHYHRVTSLNYSLEHFCANGLAVLEGCPFVSHPS